MPKIWKSVRLSEDKVCPFCIEWQSSRARRQINVTESDAIGNKLSLFSLQSSRQCILQSCKFCSTLAGPLWHYIIQIGLLLFLEFRSHNSFVIVLSSPNIPDYVPFTDMQLLNSDRRRTNRRKEWLTDWLSDWLIDWLTQVPKFDQQNDPGADPEVDLSIQAALVRLLQTQLLATTI